MRVKSAQADEGGGARPTLFTISTNTITYKVVVYAPAKRTDTVPLFLLYPHMYSVVTAFQPEPVFVNNYGAQESIPRNRFRQPMSPGGPVRQVGFRTDTPGWESISGLLERSTNGLSAEILNRGVRHRVGIALSYRPIRLH
jgi:hypothetical protein